MDDRIVLAKRIAERGATLIRMSVHGAFTSREKGRNDYVTSIDQEIEDRADSEIKGAFPDDTILGEENGRTSGTSNYTWIIDPVDGTNNFVRGIPLAGIQIAIQHNDEVVFGVAINPFLGNLYWAEKGAGAFVQDIDGGSQSPMRVSTNCLRDSLLIYDSAIAEGEPRSRNIFNALLGEVGWVRIFGVACFDLPLVAQGSADLLISNIPKPVDIAPGCLFIQEAGGVITDFDERPWSMNSTSIIAGNTHNHHEALVLVAKALQLGR